MLKKLMITTALSGLMLSSAMAQYSSPATPNAAPPAASSDSIKSDALKSSDAMKSDISKPSSASASTSSGAIASQKPDQLLASKFKGADVLGADDKKIGDVSDILFTKDGKIDAYLISVGGFLGVGSKEVALAPSSVQLIQDKDTLKVKVSMTKDQLAQAPNFERHKEQRTTTGAATTGATTAPRNSPNAGVAPVNPPANRP